MNEAAKVLRFILFIPLSIALLYGMYWCIGQLVLWINKLSLGWAIVVFLLATSIIIGIGMTVFAFLGGILNSFNPYRKLGFWIVMPVAAIMALLNIYIMWKVLDLSYTRHIISGIFASVLVVYFTIAFAVAIGTDPENR